MKRRLIQFATTYFLFVFIFILQKPLFMAYYHTLYTKASVADWFSVIWHGLPLDFSLAGYFTVIPGLLLMVTAWTQSNIIRQIRRIYFLAISILLACIFIGDLGLYGYWGFRLDSTPLFYLTSSPKDAIASVSFWVVLAGIVGAAVYAYLLYLLFSWMLIRQKQPLKIPFHRMSASLAILLATALLFIPIRGGFKISTMNLSKVYFSPNQQLNHAAINPCFSLLESLSRQSDFASQYRFYSPEQANQIFAKLTDKPVTDSIPQLFNTSRPNVLLVILESFSSHLMTTLGGEPNIAVNLDKLSEEAVLFTNFYANGFRTDRGVAAIIASYPTQPTTSIMKYPKKTQSLPSLPGSMKKAGYDLQYYYGGDIDFTNTRSFLMGAGIENIVSDQDFPLMERLSKFGAHDHILFNRVLSDMRAQKPKEPFFKVVQTSSSHEPFDVPYQRLEDVRANSFAYADSCVGDFIRQFKEMPEWGNTVVVLVADHQGFYPRGIENHDPRRYQIPLLFIGGAVKSPQKIATYGSQIDLAATLLGQLGIAHDEFMFSKNMLNPASPHFAFFAHPNLFGMITEENEAVFDCESSTVILDKGSKPGMNVPKGKAYLQKLYDDIASR